MTEVVNTYKGISGVMAETLGLCLIVILVAWALMCVELFIKWAKTDAMTTIEYAKHLLLAQLSLLPDSNCDARYCHPLNEVSNWNKYLLQKLQGAFSSVGSVASSRAGLISEKYLTGENIHISNAASNIQIGISYTHQALSLLWLSMEIIITKLMVIILALPMILLGIVMGLVDGLVMRDIRKMGVGRESTYLFHAIKEKLFPLILLFLFVFMVFPVPVSPMLIIIPLSIAIAALTAIAASRFKKYI